jgi:serine/threonine protein kinase
VSEISDGALARLAALLEAPEIPGARYRVLARLGGGGMGDVWLARDAALDRDVAIKVVRARRDGAELAARLEREARTIARIDHASVVPVHEIGVLGDGRPYYVMKHVAGATLREWRRAGAVGELAALRVFLRSAEAVAHAHSLGVVHRDLKPDNVMVGAHGELYVVDWGLAKALASPADEPASEPRAGEPLAGATGHGAVLGTPGYMAPEQARGESASVDRTADVFALGGILAFLLTGSDPPERGEVALASAARPLRSIVRKARASEPSQRYATAAELAADVARFLDRERVSAHSETVPERAARLFERHRVVVWLLVGYFALRALVFFLADR